MITSSLVRWRGRTTRNESCGPESVHVTSRGRCLACTSAAMAKREAFGAGGPLRGKTRSVRRASAVGGRTRGALSSATSNWHLDDVLTIRAVDAQQWHSADKPYRASAAADAWACAFTYCDSSARYVTRPGRPGLRTARGWHGRARVSRRARARRASPQRGGHEPRGERAPGHG